MNETARPKSQAATEPATGFIAGRPVAGWLQDIVPYGIFTTDRELRVTTWNEWLIGHSGLSAAQVVGRKLSEIYPGLEERRLLPRYVRALEGEVSVLSSALHKYLLPLPVTVPESGEAFMHQSARVAPLPDGAVIAGTITIIEDVTEREYQAGILGRQQTFDQMLSEALGSLLQSSDPITEANEIFGRLRLALVLDTYAYYLLSPTGDKLELRAMTGFSPKQRETISTLPLSINKLVTLRYDLQDGASQFPFEALHTIGLRGQWVFPLTIADRIIGLVAFGSYERDTLAAADTKVLARISRYVAIAIDRARRERETLAASRAKDDFLAALSHELRNPLNPVLLIASEAANNDEYPENAREDFRFIEKNVILEARLIDDLLDLTRITHGKLSIQMRPLSVALTLRDAIQTVQSELDVRQLTFREDLNDGGRLVMGDSGRLQQVFWNILKNARKFTPDGGQIFVSSVVDLSRNEIVVEVTDTGIGMGPDELARIFEAFSQGDHAGKGGSHRFGGLGLGLAISRKLVEMHHGRIEAKSPGKGKGSTFTVHLPLMSA